MTDNEELVSEVKSPEIEKEVDLENETDLKEYKRELNDSQKSELEKIKDNPFNYIRNFYEEMMPHIGGRVFSLICLLPLSLVAPKIMINERMIRIHIHALWLSPSGMGKSTIVREFSKITHEALITKEMTSARLEKELYKRSKTSLLIEDVSIWFADEEKVKLLEGVLGEEESFSRETMRNIKKGTNRHIDVVAFMSGTPENIRNNKIQTGILRRVSPIIVYLSPDEHKDIIGFIHNGVNNKKQTKDSSIIQTYYEEIANIQGGYNNEIEPIEGYIVSDEIKRNVSDFFVPLTLELHKKYRISMATESEEFWRFACCHALLRIFEKHKKGMIQDNKVVIDYQDIEIAKKLIIREISCKSIILQCIYNLDYYNIRTNEQLLEWEDKRRRAGLKDLPKEAKFIMQSNVK